MQTLLPVVSVLSLSEQQVSHEHCYYVMSSKRKDPLFIIMSCIIYSCTFSIFHSELGGGQVGSDTWECITHSDISKLVLDALSFLLWMQFLCHQSYNVIFMSLFICAVNGFVGSPGGSSLGKILPSKSPLPHPGNSLLPSSRKTDLRVVIPHSKGMMQTLVSVCICVRLCACVLGERFLSLTSSTLFKKHIFKHFEV